MKISVTQCTGIGTQYKGKKICKIFVGNKLIPITTNHLYNSLGYLVRHRYRHHPNLLKKGKVHAGVRKRKFELAGS